jgi:hypothetical protein
MKCIIFSPSAQILWVKEFFPGINPYFLKYLNKPLLEYYIDFCVLVGIEQVRLINSEPVSELEEHFGNGRQWGIELSYGFAKLEDSLEMVLAKNKKYCEGDLLIVYGYQFIKYNKQQSQYTIFASNKTQAVRQMDNWLYCLRDIEDIRELDLTKIEVIGDSNLGIAPMTSIYSYYEQNLLMIKKYRSHYVLPGYNNEDGAYLGKNIIDKKSTIYNKPIVLGNNVQIQLNTVIGPNVILGNNVIIDHSTHIANSIIYDQSYIGSDLEIENKIVYRKRVIDPFSEEVMKVVDSFLVSDIQNNIIENSLQRMISGLISVVLILLTTVPYLFFILLLTLSGMKIRKKKYYLDHEGNTDELCSFDLKGYNVFKRFFYRFSLDLYPLYFKVLQGKLLLAGNHLIQQNPSAIKQLMQLPLYHPGIYDYSGSMLHNQEHENFINDELEYIHKKSFFFDLKVILNYWISRLFSQWCSITEYLGEGCETS